MRETSMMAQFFNKCDYLGLSITKFALLKKQMVPLLNRATATDD